MSFHYCNFYDIAKYRKSCSNEIFWPNKPISQIYLESFENCSNEISSNEIHIRRGSPVMQKSGSCNYLEVALKSHY